MEGFFAFGVELYGHIDRKDAVNMDRQSINRINELTGIARERELTPAESEERAELRLKYLAAFRAQMRGQLENTVVQYPDGTRKPLSSRKTEPKPGDAES